MDVPNKWADIHTTQTKQIFLLINLLLFSTNRSLVLHHSVKNSKNQDTIAVLLPILILNGKEFFHRAAFYKNVKRQYIPQD